MKKQPGWALPNLKDAQVRTTKEAVIEKSLFQIPEQIRLLGQGKKYYLRTAWSTMGVPRKTST